VRLRNGLQFTRASCADVSASWDKSSAHADSGCRMRPAPCAILQPVLRGINWPKGNHGRCWHSVSQLPVVGGDEIYAGFTGPGVTRLITRNPANSVNVARQMRAAAAAHPAGDKARVVVIEVAAPVAGVMDRIALLKRSAPDAEAAPACNWDNQAHLRRIKRYRPWRE
jgi:hypothetical protein